MNAICFFATSSEDMITLRILYARRHTHFAWLTELSRKKLRARVLEALESYRVVRLTHRKKLPADEDTAGADADTTTAVAAIVTPAVTRAVVSRAVETRGVVSLRRAVARAIANVVARGSSIGTVIATGLGVV